MSKTTLCSCHKQDTVRVTDVEDIYSGLKDQIIAFNWYIELLGSEIIIAKEHNSPLPLLHSTLLYQHLVAFEAVLEEVKDCLPEKEVKK